MEIAMPSRRSLVSYVLGSAARQPARLLCDQPSLCPIRSPPKFVGIDGWLNTDGPLTMAGLRGKVVLVEFCTYTCINSASVRYPT